MQHAPPFPALLLVAAFAGGCRAEPPVAEPEPRGDAEIDERPRAYELASSPDDAEIAAELTSMLDAGVVTVEAFFGHPFRTPFDVVVLPDRAAFDRSFPPEWGVPETECWMVATGVADSLRILSPRAWSAEACEHDGEDDAHVRGIVVHELTHVYHGQYHPTGDFAGTEEIGWFVEGLAVVVSGQLDEKRADAKDAVEQGQAPARLAEAWSGRYRYAVSGSMVAFIETLAGREALFHALGFTRESELLELLGLQEQEFLDAWSEYALATLP